MANLINYQNYLKQQKLKPGTIRIYLWHLSHFLNWLDSKKLQPDILKEYYNFLLKRYKKIASINLRLVIINSYLQFNKNKFQFTLLSPEKSNIKVLNKKQLMDFLDLPTKTNNLLHLRDKIILELLYQLGAKPGELISILRQDINLAKNQISWEKKKISLPETTKFYLAKYLNKRIDSSPWLLINLDRANRYNEQPLTIRSIERIVEKYARQLEPILNITPQTLRHTRAYHLKHDGGTAATIQTELQFKTKAAAENYYKKL